MIRVEELALLIEDLDAVIASIGHIQTSLRIELQGVRRTELSGPEAELAPLLDEGAVGRELENPPGRAGRRVQTLPAVAVGHEDVAIRSDDHVARLVELAGPAAGLTSRTQAEQLLAFRAKLDHLMALGAGFVPLRVSDPDVAVVVDVQPVRQHEQPGPEACQHLAGVAVELQNRVDGWIGLAAAFQGNAAAAVVRPDVTVGADVDAGRGPPRSTVGQVGPLRDDLGGRIRQRPHDEVARALRFRDRRHLGFRRRTAARDQSCQRHRGQCQGAPLRDEPSIVSHSALLLL